MLGFLAVCHGGVQGEPRAVFHKKFVQYLLWITVLLGREQLMRRY